MSARTRTIWTFVVTSLGLFMVVLDNLVVSTALPVIRTDLSASLEQLEWTVNAYTLTFAVLLLTGAALGDRFGRRLLFVIGLAIFTAASAAAALAPSADWLIAARAVQGVGARDRDAADADDPERGRPARAARSRARRLVGRGRPRRGRRPARRRRRRRGHCPGSGSSGSTCRRPAPAAAGHAAPARVEGARGRARPARPRCSSAPVCSASSGGS